MTQEQNQSLVVKAMDLHQKGKLDKAESLYGKVLKSAPEKVDALHFMGVLHFNRNRMAEAYDLIGKALALNPMICQDLDADMCDDCSVGTDGFGPGIDADITNDGPDLDGDDICDVGDADRDGDGFNNDVDNCPDAVNAGQEDSNNNGVGDACEIADSDDESCVPVVTQSGPVVVICL